MPQTRASNHAAFETNLCRQSLVLSMNAGGGDPSALCGRGHGGVLCVPGRKGPLHIVVVEHLRLVIGAARLSTLIEAVHVAIIAKHKLSHRAGQLDSRPPPLLLGLNGVCVVVVVVGTAATSSAASWPALGALGRKGGAPRRGPDCAWRLRGHDPLCTNNADASDEEGDECARATSALTAGCCRTSASAMTQRLP